MRGAEKGGRGLRYSARSSEDQKLMELFLRGGRGYAGALMSCMHARLYDCLSLIVMKCGS